MKKTDSEKSTSPQATNPPRARENKRNWYLTISESFFRELDYKRMRLKLCNCPNVTAIYLKMILLAVKDNPAKNAEDITINFLHDYETLHEELALAIDEAPEEVAEVVDYMLDRGLLQETAPGIFRIFFPEGTVGSITDSSLRSRKTREKKREALQSNTTATQQQQNGNHINNNINNQSYKNSNSNSYFCNNSDYKTINLKTGGAEEDRPDIGGGLPSAVFFSFEEVQEQANRRENRLPPAELFAMYSYFCKSGFSLILKYQQDGETEQAAIFHAINTWAAKHHYPDAPELEEINAFTEKELRKLFPSYSGKEDQDILRDAFIYWDDQEGAEYGNSELASEVWEFTDRVLKVVREYISKEFQEMDSGGLYEMTGLEDGDDWEPTIPKYCPKNAFTKQQRQFLYTAFNIRFPADPVPLWIQPGEGVKSSG